MIRALAARSHQNSEVLRWPQSFRRNHTAMLRHLPKKQIIMQDFFLQIRSENSPSSSRGLPNASQGSAWGHSQTWQWHTWGRKGSICIISQNDRRRPPKWEHPTAGLSLLSYGLACNWDQDKHRTYETHTTGEWKHSREWGAKVVVFFIFGEFDERGVWSHPDLKCTVSCQRRQHVPNLNLSWTQCFFTGDTALF